MKTQENCFILDFINSFLKFFLWMAILLKKKGSFPPKSQYSLYEEDLAFGRKEEYLQRICFLGEAIIFLTVIYGVFLPQIAPWILIGYATVGFISDLGYQKKFGESFLE